MESTPHFNHYSGQSESTVQSETHLDSVEPCLLKNTTLEDNFLLTLVKDTGM